MSTLYDIQHHFPFDVQPSHAGKVTLTVEIEAIHVRCFLQMLNSLSSFFNIINSKAKVALAYTRQEEINAAGEKYYAEFASAVVDTFKQLRRETGEHARPLISATLREIKQIYPNACYDNVKQILTKSGELKKNGFYQKK
ncbi:MAG: hypothetical protein FIA89_12615 [Geobacter sp.]|nr:hypothetical protein [Geobacter sp.]